MLYSDSGYAPDFCVKILYKQNFFMLTISTKNLSKVIININRSEMVDAKILVVIVPRMKIIIPALVLFLSNQCCLEKLSIKNWDSKKFS